MLSLQKHYTSIISIIQVKADSHLVGDYISIHYFDASSVATQEI